MDPYLERHWEDVHTALIGYIRDALQPQLADDLIARMEEKVYVEDVGGERRLRRPDVRVVEGPHWGDPAPGGSGGGIATLAAPTDEPLLLEAVGDPIRHRSVLIYDSAGKRIVTAIEILSPWNKHPGRAVTEYLDKRDKYVNSAVNLVEIDLVRAGDSTDMIGPYVVPEDRLTTYRVTVVQPGVRGPYLYPIAINAKLPLIRVPLRPHDAPVTLDLHELLDRAYVMGRYDRIDYARPCVPPLTGGEAAWADEVLRTAGKR